MTDIAPVPLWLKTKALPDAVLIGGSIGVRAIPPLALNCNVPRIGIVGVPEAIETLPALSTETTIQVT